MIRRAALLAVARPKVAAAATAVVLAAAGVAAGLTLTSSSPWTFQSAYNAAKPGDTIQVPAGTYGTQVIGSRADLRNLVPGCTPSTPAQCVRFVGQGVRINGSLEIHGSDVMIDGGLDPLNPGFAVTGYIDTEADSNSVYPDHVLAQGVDTSSFGVFNSKTVTFRNMDVGPATVTGGCGFVEGPAIENKIGWAGGNTVVPTDVTLDGLRIHDQNGTQAREASDCHMGGLFLMTVDGLVIKNTVFERNVVYHVQIQNFGGSPPARNVVFENDAFSCPVDWIYRGLRCDGQSSIQFDGTFQNVTVRNTHFAEGGDRGWACVVGTCDFSTDTFGPGNVFDPPSTTAPALLNGGPPPPPPPPPGLNVRELSRTASTITVGWTPQPGTYGYVFFRDSDGNGPNPAVRLSSTFNAALNNTRFALVPGALYTVVPFSKMQEGSVTG